jgi:hypothetical protein
VIPGVFQTWYLHLRPYQYISIQHTGSNLQVFHPHLQWHTVTILWSDISGTLWLLVFFRHDTYIYDPISIYLYNIQEVIYRCFTHIYSGLTSVEHWFLVFFRHDTYMYDPISIYLYNIQEVICRCFTHIYSGTVTTLWKIIDQSDIQQKHFVCTIGK